MASKIVEHVALFRVKSDAPPEKVEALIGNLKSLGSFEGVLETTIGPLLKETTPLFTHGLHRRFKDKATVEAYKANPLYLQVVELGREITDDGALVEWERKNSDEVVVSEKAEALRIALFKTADPVEQEKLEKIFIQAVEFFPDILEVSYGANVSEFANGYGFGIVSKFKTLQALRAVDSDPRTAQFQEHLPKSSDYILVELAVNS